MIDRNRFRTMSQAYLAALADVLDYPQYVCAPRGLPIREILDYRLEVSEPSSEPIVTRDEDRNKVIADYTKKEFDWYMTGSLDVKDAEKISKFWGRLTNTDGETINSNYGNLIFFDKSEGDVYMERNGNSPELRTPFEWAKLSLMKDKDTRQAIMRINKPRHLWVGNKDVVCNLHGIFFIRENQLHLSIVQRSADVFTGIVYDMPFFAYVQQRMLEELKPTYPELTLGMYSHQFHSLHAYEKDFNKIRKMLGRPEEA